MAPLLRSLVLHVGSYSPATPGFVPVGSYSPATPGFESIEVLTIDSRYRRKVAKGTAPTTQEKRSTRGAIVGLSKANRLHALTALRNGPKWATSATLTFPFPVTDGRAAKGFLEHLLKRLERRGMSLYWSLEFQRSGRPHFHLLLTEDVSTEEFREMWAGALGHSGYVHVHASPVRDRDRAIYYAVKEEGDPCRIVPQGFTNPGRFWGLRGPDSRPKVLLRVVAPKEVMARLWRPLRNLYASYSRRLGKRRSRDNGVAGRLLWGVGGDAVARAVLRLIEYVTGKSSRNYFRASSLTLTLEVSH